MSQTQIPDFGTTTRIRRPQLINSLVNLIQSSNRYISIYAGRGYGKTMLLVDFAQTIDDPVCWLRCTSAQRVPASFLTLMAESIKTRFPDQLHHLEQSQGAGADIAHALNITKPIVIIDDFHLAASAGTVLALTDVIEQSPQTIFIIATQEEIDLPDFGCTLDEADLCFTATETQTFIRKRFGRQLDDETIAEIIGNTNGSPTEILVAGHMLDADPNIGYDQQAAVAFFDNHILARQPLELQRFLLHTAILPEMTIELCNELLDIENAGDHLTELVRRELFITQNHNTYQYHPAFARFLHDRLAEDTETYRRNAVRAGKMLVERNQIAEAILLYLSAKAWDNVAATLETEGHLFFISDQATALYHWLCEIPETELTQRPRLLLLKGQILNNNLGQLDAAMEIFERVERIFERRGDQVGVGEVKVWRSANLRSSGQLSKSIDVVNSGLELLMAAEEDELIGWGMRNRGATLYFTGQAEAAIEDLSRALEMLEKANNIYYVGMCYHELGIASARLGDINQSFRHYRHALQCWMETGGENDLVNTLNSLGVSCYLLGRYDEAIKNFNDCLQVATRINDTRRVAFAYAGLGDAYLDLEDLDCAEEAYNKSTDSAKMAGAAALEIYNTIRLGEIALQQDDLLNAATIIGRARWGTVERGLILERGLAAFLQAKIEIRRRNYSGGLELLAEAEECIYGNDLPSELRVRLWRSLCLLLVGHTSAAHEQLERAIGLVNEKPDLYYIWLAAASEVAPLILHFHYRHKDQIAEIVTETAGIIQATDTTHGPLLYVFGQPAAIVNGKYQYLFTLRRNSRKIIELMLFLIFEDQEAGYSWEDIGVVLYPDGQPGKTRRLVGRLVDRAQHIFGEGCIRILDNRYRANVEYFAYCDALVYKPLVNTLTVVDRPELQSEFKQYYKELAQGFRLGNWGQTWRERFGSLRDTL